MRQVIAVLLIVLVGLPLAVAALGLFAVSGWVADRGFYLGLVSDERIYEGLLDERLLERADRFVERSGPRAPGGLPLDGIPPRVLVPALREVVTPAYLRGEAVRLVNEAFDRAEGKLPAGPLEVNLAPLKAGLAGEAGGRFAAALAAALPVCPAGGQPVLPGATLPRCRPAQQSTEAAAARIRASLPALAARFPDRYPLDREADFGVWRSPEGWWFYGPGPRLMRWIAWAGVLIALLGGAALLGAAFLAGRTRREILQWLGWPLLAPGGLMLLIGLSIRLATTGLGWWAGASASAAWAELARAAMGPVSAGFLAAGGVTLGIAAGLVAWALSTPEDTKPA